MTSFREVTGLETEEQRELQCFAQTSHHSDSHLSKNLTLEKLHGGIYITSNSTDSIFVELPHAYTLL